jgi:hypothetical protein
MITTIINTTGTPFLVIKATILIIAPEGDPVRVK